MPLSKKHYFFPPKTPTWGWGRASTLNESKKLVINNFLKNVTTLQWFYFLPHIKKEKYACIQACRLTFK